MITDPAITLERCSSRIYDEEQFIARIEADEALSDEAKAVLVAICRRRISGLRAAATRAARMLS